MELIRKLKGNFMLTIDIDGILSKITLEDIKKVEIRAFKRREQAKKIFLFQILKKTKTIINGDL